MMMDRIEQAAEQLPTLTEAVDAIETLASDLQDAAHTMLYLVSKNEDFATDGRPFRSMMRLMELLAADALATGACLHEAARLSKQAL